MSYSITPDKRVLKNGVEVGHIEGGTAYMDDPPRGRGIASFRAMAGMPNLKFEAVNKVPPNVEIEPHKMQPFAIEKVKKAWAMLEPSEESTPALPEPPNNPHLGDKDPVWQRWFIATNGEDAFKSRWPNRQLPQ